MKKYEPENNLQKAMVKLLDYTKLVREEIPREVDKIQYRWNRDKQHKALREEIIKLLK